MPMLQQPFGSNWLLAFARLLMLLEFSQAPLELSVHFQAPLFRSGLRWSKRNFAPWAGGALRLSRFGLSAADLPYIQSQSDRRVVVLCKAAQFIPGTQSNTRAQAKRIRFTSTRTTQDRCWHGVGGGYRHPSKRRWLQHSHLYAL